MLQVKTNYLLGMTMLLIILIDVDSLYKTIQKTIKMNRGLDSHLTQAPRI